MAAAPGDFERCHLCGGEPPYGHAPSCPYRRSAADAADAMTGVAAPLLAGFTISLIGFVVASPERARWPGLSLLLLTLSALTLLLCVQAGFWARRYKPDPDNPGPVRARPESSRYVSWSAVARIRYNSGISLLLLSLGDNSCSAGRARVRAAVDRGGSRSRRYPRRGRLGRLDQSHEDFSRRRSALSAGNGRVAFGSDGGHKGRHCRSGKTRARYAKTSRDAALLAACASVRSGRAEVSEVQDGGGTASTREVVADGLPRD